MNHRSKVLGLLAAAALLGLWASLSLVAGLASPSSGAAPAESPPPSVAVVPLAPALRDSSVVTWTPAEVAQGTLFQLTVTAGSGELSSATATFGGEPLHFFPGDGGAFTALAAAPVDAGTRLDLNLDVDYASGVSESLTIPIPIRAGDYRMERLTVAPEFGQPQPPEIQARINDENARAMAVSRGSHGTPRMWQLPFVPPRDGGITSGFGHGRMFNDQVQSRHTGTDFGGGVGAPVVAPALGRVALVDAFYLGGNVIYLDHGAGLVTAYLHLSEQNVQAGDTVEPGQIIGRVGATGRVTGPHLHWIVRYGVVSVDGLSLLALR